MLPAPTTTRNLHPALGDVAHLVRDSCNALGVGPVLQRAHQGLAGELQKDPLEDRVGHAGAGIERLDPGSRIAPTVALSAPT